MVWQECQEGVRKPTRGISNAFLALTEGGHFLIVLLHVSSDKLSPLIQLN